MGRSKPQCGEADRHPRSIPMGLPGFGWHFPGPSGSCAPTRKLVTVLAAGLRAGRGFVKLAAAIRKISNASLVAGGNDTAICRS